jgi:hypothetical protein|tara:strand:+ start:236 stop:787 length:552 start_codon:yes stop_codon:yes gene_type:complete
MKIYTEVNYEWDNKENKLVEVSSKSHDYKGDVALLQSYTGPQDYGNLWEMQQDPEAFSAWLSTEFGLSPGSDIQDYTSYFEPLRQEPFEQLAGAYTLGREKVGMDFRDQYKSLQDTIFSAKSQSGFATYRPLEQKKDMLTQNLYDTYEMGMGAAKLDYEKGVYDEEGRQTKGFYDRLAQVRHA